MDIYILVFDIFEIRYRSLFLASIIISLYIANGRVNQDLFTPMNYARKKASITCDPKLSIPGGQPCTYQNNTIFFVYLRNTHV